MPPSPQRCRVLGLLLTLGSAWPAATAGAQPDAAQAAPPSSPRAGETSSDSSRDAPAGEGTSPSAPRPGLRPASSQGQPPKLEPPRIVENVPPEYPREHLGHAEQPTVILHVVLDAEGQVQAAHVDHSAGTAFDEAALAAIRRWKFAPARRDGQPIAASVHVAVPFRLPQFDLQPMGAGEVLGHTATDAEAYDHAEVGDPSGEPAARAAARDPHHATLRYGAQAEVELEALRTETRGASDVRVDRAVLEAAPRQEGAEVLRTAPGLFIGRGEGDAVAHRFMLRGFDSDHGQDLALSVGGLPINLPSHIHGQGYADLGFLIGEVVDAVHVKEGVYDPAQGDFAVAGSIDLDLAVRRRGVRLKSGYGSFRTFRQLAVWAPPAERAQTFGAVQLRRSDGFGENRESRSGSGIAQYAFGEGRWKLRALGIFYGARADHAGVLRQDDIDAGVVDFYDVYPLATARAQNAASARALLGLFATHRGPDGGNGELGVWLGYDDFRLQENFTGFVQRSRQLSGVAGRGDLIAQENRTASLGISSRYRTAPYAPVSWAKARLELGLTGRFDVIDQTQSLIDPVRNQVWDERVDASIRAADLGMWGDINADLTEHLTLRAGLRSDVLYYDVDDALQNRVPLVRGESFIEGFRRSALGIAWGPRLSAEARPLPWLALIAAYGEGYRSPQARTLEDGEEAPFTRVRSADLGARIALEERLELRVAGYWTRLSDDVAFEAREGRLERIGATQRLGGVLYAKAQPLPWLVGAASLTYVDAELLDPPPPTAEDPQPPFEPGQNLPFVPPLILRADLGAKHAWARRLGAYPLHARAGVGYTYLARRPLPFGARAVPVSLIDASAGVGWGPFELGLEIYNLLDTRYAAVEHNFPSHWDPDAPPSRLPARHISAGAPRTVMATLEVQL